MNRIGCRSGDRDHNDDRNAVRQPRILHNCPSRFNRQPRLAITNPAPANPRRHNLNQENPMHYWIKLLDR